MSCYDENQLLGFLAGDLSTEERAALQRHLDSCEECGDLVAWLASETATNNAPASTVAANKPAGGEGAALDTTVPPLELTRSAYVTDPAPLAMDGWLLEAGAELDDYRVVEPLGRGGMGEVYLAVDRKLRRRVALKILRRGQLDERSLERFLFEARATARFNHPNIVTVHAVGDDNGRPYLALEYVDGTNLHLALRERQFAGSRASRSQLPLDEIVDIALGVAAALAEAHSHHILHRDLKPANVLVGNDGRARVLDFGLAQVTAAPTEDARERDSFVGAIDGQRRAGPMLAGTPAYFSPEQWRGEALPASDVWALGLLVVELCTGRRPYGALPRDELERVIISDQPMPIPLDMPAALADIARACLAKSAQQRPSAAKARDALQAVANQLLVTSQLESGSTLRGAPAPARGPKAAGPPWRKVAVVAGVVLGLAAAVAVGYSLRPAATPPVATPGTSTSTGTATSAIAATKRAQRSGAQRGGAQRGGAQRRGARPSPSPSPDSEPRTKSQPSPNTRTRPPRPHTRRAKAKANPRRYGKLYVYSYGADGDEQWAQIFVDGRYRGDTPKTLSRIPAGKHRVEVRRAGFVSRRRVVRVKANRRAVVSFEMRRR